MDALNFNIGGFRRHDQFKKENIDRELKKAYIAFKQESASRPICTGNWGTGQFGGDYLLKAQIQWIAASLAGAPSMVYCSFGNREAQEI